ncbi:MULTISPECIES: DUF4747 family protein [Synergistaceae]|uniref:DUF4747 family protein n=1 Tax=Synergistaceae TaxID=649777 RepID=UPI003AE86CED|nr:DUF4747 family protein [Synergistaceae bacterium DZ-S4]
MSKDKRLKYYIINIKTQPQHSPELYSDLFLYAFNNGLEGKIRGSERLMLSGVTKYEDNTLTGLICRFTNIEEKSRWFDKIEKKPVENDNAPYIPTNMKPNLRESRFVFDLRKHYMFIHTALSPYSIATGLIDLFDKQEIEDKFGSVDVVVVKDRNSIEQIISLPMKRSLQIKITIPNPDDLEEAAIEMEERLREANVRKYQVSQTAMPGEPLGLTEDIKTLLQLSITDGQAKAVGTIDGERVSVSTSDYPLEQYLTYDPKITTETSALYNVKDVYFKKR